MRTIPFTTEQIKILKENPYTANVTAQRIHYTLDFKIFAMKEVATGLTSVKLFKKAGYDPEILGKNRMYGALKAIKREAASPEGLQPPSCMKQAERFAQEDFSRKQTKKAFTELQDKIVFLEQEIELLKKFSIIRKQFGTDNPHKD